MNKTLIDIIIGVSLGTYIYLEFVVKRTGVDFIRSVRGIVPLLLADLGGIWIAETIRTRIFSW